ncbi:MAG TPA: BBP7 family outer membrane beta-barrel protein [Gemmataceae bacterium]|nr:BBP7 family outer membrane beta-barrel protein [Gemmataceae bacterium]
MRSRWASGLGLVLGWSLAAAQAGESQWRPAKEQTNLAQPTAGATSEDLGVSLGRPVPLKAPAEFPAPSAPADEAVVPVSYQTNAPGLVRPVVRGQSADASPPEPAWPSKLKPMPNAPDEDNGSFASDEQAPAPRPTRTSSFASDCGGGGCLDACADACSPSTCGGDAVCCSPGEHVCRWYGSAELLLWWTKGQHMPPLVTTSSAASAGILGAPDTVVLFGGSVADRSMQPGGRFTIGRWFGPCQNWALETTYFFLSDDPINFSVTSDRFPVLARPFFNINTGTEFSEVIASPGLARGAVAVYAPMQFWGIELNARKPIYNDCCWKLDVLAGFRHLELNEGLHVTEGILVDPAVPGFGGDSILVTDRFNTRNNFYGGQLGLLTEWRRGRWSLDARWKVALGATHEVVNITGAQLVTPPGGSTSVFVGGLDALPSNIGRHDRTRFAVVPEVGVNLGFNFTPWLRGFLGYNFLYWSNVVRPGEQIDREINVRQIPGPNFPTGGSNTTVARPTVPFKSTDFWAHGVNLGLELKY